MELPNPLADVVRKIKAHEGISIQEVIQRYGGPGITRQWARIMDRLQKPAAA